MGYISATLGSINIKFTEYVDTVSRCRMKFSKSGVTRKFGLQGGSNFQVVSHSGPPGGQIYTNTAVMLCPFSRTLNPLKNARYLEHQPHTHNLYKGALKIATFVECHIFRGTLCRNDATFWGFSACVL